MEDILEKLIEKYPNYGELGKKIHEIYLILQTREKTPHIEYDSIDEKIFITKLI